MILVSQPSKYNDLISKMVTLSFRRPIPSLPVQSWGQYIGDVLGTHDMGDEFDPFSIGEGLEYMPESFDFLQGQNESPQWAMGGDVTPPESANEPRSVEEYVCYGMVS
jgi:hypothetical protein